MNDVDLLAELPPPRDDEPSSLRQDIADELADHLACAFHRELVKSGDAASATKRVLERFGDPQRIARQLWRQAMWSRIMKARVSQAVQIVLVMTCILLVALLWARDKGLAKQLQGHIALLNLQQAQTAKDRAELLEKIAALELRLAERARPTVVVPEEPVRTTLQVELLQGDPPGQPVTSGSVTLQGVDLLNKHLEATRGIRPERGPADFGEVLPGSYQLQVQSNGMNATIPVTAPRGSQRVETVLCPPELGALVTPTIQVQWPRDLQSHPLWLIAKLNADTWTHAGHEWRLMDDSIELIANATTSYAYSARRAVRIFDQRDFTNVDYPGGRAAVLDRMRFLPPFASQPDAADALRRFAPHVPIGAAYHLDKLMVITDPNELAPRPQRSFFGKSNRATYDRAPVLVRLTHSETGWPAELNRDFRVDADRPWVIALPEVILTEVRRQIEEFENPEGISPPADGTQPINVTSGKASGG